MTIRLMIADDEAISRAGVIRMVEGSEVEIVCMAGRSDEAVRFALTTQPDVLLLDVHMPVDDGFTALERVKQERPEMCVLMFSSTDDLKEITQARALGAAGYITKDISREGLLLSIRRAAAGKKTWTREQIRRVSSRFAKEAVEKKDFAPLSARQREVLEKLAVGMPNEEIAEDLGVDIETVKQHVKQILRALRVDDRTQAAVWALRRKFHSKKDQCPEE